jgi:enolase-phosphatase E1
VLLDVEGTVGPISFVKETLFPYAASRMSAFLAEHSAEPAVRSQIDALRTLHVDDVSAGLRPPAWSGEDGAAASSYALWLSAQDRKATPLKALQGLIWQSGYASGALKAPVYDDVPAVLEQLHARERAVAIYSSGSVLAQRLYFAHTTAGDLTPFIREYFDTTVGAKTEPSSYRAIASRLGCDERDVVFVSDSAAEIDAARTAGMNARLCVREGDVSAGAIRDLRVIDGL